MKINLLGLLPGTTRGERDALAEFVQRDNRLTLPPVLLACELFKHGARLGLRATLGEGYAVSRLLRTARRYLHGDAPSDALKAEYARYARRTHASPSDLMPVVARINTRGLPAAEPFARQLLAHGVFLMCPDEVAHYTAENRALAAVGDMVQPEQGRDQYARNLRALRSALAALK